MGINGGLWSSEFNAFFASCSFYPEVSGEGTPTYGAVKV